MTYFGNKENFAIAFELKKSPFNESEKREPSWGEFQMWVHNNSVCTFSMDDKIREYEWDLSFIVEWFYINKDYILEEIPFPLPCEGNNAIELYNNSGDFDSDDDNEFNSWYEKRQDWYFTHSWYSNNGGSYLADVIFRRVNDTIEIAWDNTELYDNIKYVNPKGVCYISVELFQLVVDGFIEEFMNDISKSEEGKRIIQEICGKTNQTK
ncbi:hypothetical protein LAD12857_38950 [Lacrimispora amygdalina]|uniref:Uncharacterized protein n=1 Tax=Lacrimispora amygdalina TaxID=253257 RepID=A0ABQ5MAX9_9FIRM